jgi:hypothetical protein
MFTGQAIPLTRQGLQDTAARLGVGLPALWAVLCVETSGCGFLPDRRPQILFERHWFSKLTGRRFDASHPDISNRIAGGYGKHGAPQYERLERAMALDADAALSATSWGLGQVMGFNAQRAGFDNARALAAACVKAEDGQLQAMAGFIANAGLADELRREDWKGFALRYNGSGFRKNRYDTKLALFHARFSTGPLPDLTVRWVQMALLFLGYAPGKVDGWYGIATQKALIAFQQAQHLPASGRPDEATLQRLAEGIGQPVH